VKSADITEVKTLNLKGLATLKDESPEHTPLYTQGRKLQQWGGMFSFIFPTVLNSHPMTSIVLAP